MPDWLAWVGLVLILPVLNSWRNWRRHRARFQAAAARGWRFPRFTSASFFTPRFRLVGQTEAGIIWEISRQTEGGRYYLSWRSASPGLPYGRLKISPRGRPQRGGPGPESVLRSVALASQPWATRFIVQASHDILVDQYLRAEVGAHLSALPAWPEPGSLVLVDWHPAGLLICCRFTEDFAVLDRVVALGGSLTSAALFRRPTRPGREMA